jgi:hypothetical protein
MWRAFDEPEEAASEIVGELMLMAVTVLIFALLVLAVGSMMNRSETAIVTVDVQVLNGTAITLLHQGGDSLEYADLGVSINGSSLPYGQADANANGFWDVGEQMIVTGLNTSERLDIVVYDRARSQALGSYIIG